jgi:C4-dicarboxylate-specific signal transduction histidine kinase
MFTIITLRKEAERRALQAERLAAIGQVVAGLAHEISFCCSWPRN